MTEYARCRCAECVALDKLPVRRHGIPHAWQPNMLLTVEQAKQLPPPPPAEVWERWGLTPPQQPDHETLPLFAGSLEPVLL